MSDRRPGTRGVPWTAHRDALPWATLAAFAAQGFVGVTVELIPIPLQAELASDLGVSASEAGWTVSAFSASLAVLTVPIAAALRRGSPLATLLLGQLALVATTAASALAPTLLVLIVLRVLAGVALGLVWSSVGAIITRLVPREQLARATSISGAGVAAAFLLGLPAAAVLGGLIGWQLTFLAGAGAMLAAGALASVVARRGLRAGEEAERPGEPRPADPSGSLARVAAVGVLTVVVFAAQYSSFTYVVELLPAGTDPAGFLALFGGSGIAGLLVVGVWARWADRVLLGALSLLGIAIALTAAGWPWPVTAICWGVAFGGVPPLIQARALASAPPRLAQVAASVIASSFQLGILLGSLAGGAALALGTWRTPLQLSVALLAIGVVLAIATAPRR